VLSSSYTFVTLQIKTYTPRTMQPHILLTSIMLATTAVVALPATETTAVAQPDLGEIEVYLPPVKQYSGERELYPMSF
jgi:hypothetical protein